MKRLITVLFSLVFAFVSISALMFTNTNYNVSAAKVYETPYYYNQMSENGKKAYKELKKSILNCEKRVKLRIGITESDFQQLAEIFILHDPMTFNLKDMTAENATRSSITFNLSYRYTKESYNKIVKQYEAATQKILNKLDDDMSTYSKIKIIHDSIANSAEYDLDSKLNDTVYGTLVKKKAKCDGYAKTFAYVCGQAGIRVITVIGNDVYTQDDSMHMWNKVYYNKNWYNVDVTWDDPVSNMKNNRKYDFFMVGDEDFSRTHTEYSITFDIPKATDTSKSYFKMYKKYANDLSSAKTIIKSETEKAASNGKTYVVIQCASDKVYKQVQKYILNVDSVSSMLSTVKKNKNKNLISDMYSYAFNDHFKTIKIYIFYKGTDLDDYFTDIDEVDEKTINTLDNYGID